MVIGPDHAPVRVELYSLNGNRLAVYRGLTNTQLAADRRGAWFPATTWVVARYRTSDHAFRTSLLQYHP
ncbi:MAG: hypothetical protein GF331_13790 [Chitinivibrionales bacterium]|nr:hypothetical protein [Chitinivibrionales bacterium]